MYVTGRRSRERPGVVLALKSFEIRLDVFLPRLYAHEKAVEIVVGKRELLSAPEARQRVPLAAPGIRPSPALKLPDPSFLKRLAKLHHGQPSFRVR